MNITMDDVELEQWLMPYKPLTVPTCYGNTSMVAADPRDAPSLVLLPALGVTSKMWTPNIAALSREYRIHQSGHHPRFADGNIPFLCLPVSTIFGNIVFQTGGTGKLTFMTLYLKPI